MEIIVLLFLSFFVVLAVIGIISNLRQPVQTVEAQIVAKRTLIRGNSGTGTITQYHYCTFEFPLGQRREFQVNDREYGLLVERDIGRLTFQGTWFLKFERADLRGVFPESD